MKTILSLITIISVTCLCQARSVPSWSYEKLLNGSDLVVIATPVSAQDLKGEVEVPNLTFTDANGKPIPVTAVGVETKFEVQAVLRGEKNTPKDLVLYHLREPDTRASIGNGPMYTAFNLKTPTRYLMFLKRQADGRYISTTGLTDSAIGIKDLGANP